MSQTGSNTFALQLHTVDPAKSVSNVRGSGFRVLGRSLLEQSLNGGLVVVRLLNLGGRLVRSPKKLVG